MNNTEQIKIKRNLTALVEFSRIINSSLDLEFILNNVLLTCMGKFLATKAAIAVCSGDMVELKTSKGLSKEVLQKFPKMNVNDLFESKEFKDFLILGNIAVVEKINATDKCIGLVCLGEKFNKSPYSEDDIEFLKTILNICAAAIQNSLVLNELKKVNRFLDSRINRLSSLFELSKEFGAFSESDRVAKLLVYSIIGQFLVSKFAVVSFENSIVKILETKFSEDELLKAIKNYDVKAIEESITNDKIKLSFPEFHKLKVDIIVPMQLQGKTKGLIFLGKRINNTEYNDADIEFIYSIGSLAIISLENRRLFKEALAKQKMEEELEIARDIQKNLLPKEVPVFKNFEIAATNISSQHVGGDYYDIIKLDDNSFCIAIADVSGKGVPAALLMANLQAFLKTTCKQGMFIDEATALINDLITENTGDGKFITFFWGVIEDDNKTIHYVNAGHNPPLLIRDGKIIKLTKGGIILGVMKTNVAYTSEKIQLKKDDVLILFTDGISEAKNKFDEEFSDERLEEISLSVVERSANDILSFIKTEVQNFASGTLQSDDITLLILKVK